MPAAAVIPAPIAYIKVVAVKKLVVGSVCHAVGSPPVGVNWHVCGTSCRWRYGRPAPRRGTSPKRAGASRSADPIPPRCSSLSVEAGRHVYFEQIRVLKSGPL